MNLNGLGVQASPELQGCLAHLDCHAGKVTSVPTGIFVTALWANGESGNLR